VLGGAGLATEHSCWHRSRWRGDCSSRSTAAAEYAGHKRGCRGTWTSFERERCGTKARPVDAGLSRVRWHSTPAGRRGTEARARVARTENGVRGGIDLGGTVLRRARSVHLAKGRARGLGRHVPLLPAARPRPLGCRAASSTHQGADLQRALGAGWYCGCEADGSLPERTRDQDSAQPAGATNAEPT